MEKEGIEVIGSSLHPIMKQFATSLYKGFPNNSLLLDIGIQNNMNFLEWILKCNKQDRHNDEFMEKKKMCEVQQYGS